MGKSRNGLSVVLAFFALAALVSSCAGPKPKVHLEPGEQVADAEVDVKTATVTSEREGVVVKVQAAVIPAPGNTKPQPAFWVTVQNNRPSKIVIKPAATRLIDTFGNQHKPLPMMVGGDSNHPYDYIRVEPRVHFFFSVNHGWPYYPFYPYGRWGHYNAFSRTRYWHRDPFWDMGGGGYYNPYWVRQVAPTRRYNRLETEETIYQGAKMTFAVLFPRMGDMVRELRLIVPEISLYQDGQELKSLDFELIFDQIVEVKEE